MSGVTGRTRMRFPSVSRRQIGSSTTAGRYRDFEHRVPRRSSSQNEIVPAASALREISPRYQQRLPSLALFACPAILSASPPFAAGLREIGQCGDSQAISQITHKAAFELSQFPILKRLYPAKLPVICGQSIVVSSNRSAPRVVTLRSDYLNEQWACSADDRAGRHLVHALERRLNS